MPRYFLQKNDPVSGTLVDKWDEVSLADYVSAERNAGFYPKRGMPQDKPATASFSVSGGPHKQAAAGRVEYEK